MGLGKLIKKSVGNVVGSNHTKKENNNRNDKKSSSQTQQQTAVGFGNNFYWAIAPPGCTIIPIKDDSHHKNHGCMHQWPSNNTPPWKQQQQQLQQNNNANNNNANNNNGSILKKIYSQQQQQNQHYDPDTDIIEQIVCSSQSTIYVTKSGNIYQHGTIHGMVYTKPIRIPLPPLPFKIKQVSAGRHHVIALYEMGVGVLSWGAGHFGQLGIGNTGTTLSSSDDEMDDSDNDNKKKKKTKENNKANNVHERSNRHGQLTYTSKPLIIERLLPHNNVEGSLVISIAAGDWHNLALTESGTVWAWGCNRNLQCGRDPESCSDSNNTALLKVIVEYTMPNEVHPQSQSKSMSSRPPPQRDPLHHISDDESDDDDEKMKQLEHNDIHHDDLSDPIVPTIMSPTPIPLPVPVIQISAGRSHSVAIAKDTKHVYCWGNNHYGQCGNIISNRFTVAGIKPHVVKALCNMDIYKVAAGGNHTLALTSTGQVYSWGNHSEGQLGIMGGLSIGCVAQCKPRLVLELDFHSSTKEAERCSNNNDNNDISNHHIINHDNNNGNINASDLSSLFNGTGSSSAATTTSSKTTATAANDKSDATTTKKSPIITDIYAAGTYSAVISSSGHLYVWGSNDAGQLGIPKPSNPNHVPFLRDGSKLPFSKGCIGNDMSPYNSTSSLPQSIISYPTLRKKLSKRLIRNVHTFDSNHNILLPTRVEQVNHVHVQQLACGPNHMWVVGEPRTPHTGNEQSSIMNASNSGHRIADHSGEQTMYEVQMEHIIKQEEYEKGNNDIQQRKEIDGIENNNKLHSVRRVNSTDNLSNHQPRSASLRRTNSAPGDLLDDDDDNSFETEVNNRPYLPTAYNRNTDNMLHQDMEYESIATNNQPSSRLGSGNNFIKRFSQKMLRRRSSCSSSTEKEISYSNQLPKLLDSNNNNNSTSSNNITRQQQYERDNCTSPRNLRQNKK